MKQSRVSNNLALAVFVCLCVCACFMNQVTLAQEADSYATPDGEDIYGPRYQAKEVPTEIRTDLDAFGNYTVPSFMNLTIQRDQLECWVIDQIPVPGTIVSGPQTLIVLLKHTSGQNDQYWSRLPIVLSDATPPGIDVVLDSNVTPHTSFGGVQRYLAGGAVAGAAVVPIITIDDSCDQNPATDLAMDGQPYQFGTPVTAIGLHFLNVRASDASGNFDNQTYVFEIRERPSYTAAAVVQSTHCDLDASGHVESFTATVLISDDVFDHHDILMSSVQMFLRGSNGDYLSMTPITGSAPEINSCYLSMTFHAQFPQALAEMPSAVDILGVGFSGTSITFEWGAATANVANGTPVQTLLSLVGKQQLTCEALEPPPGQLPLDCEFITTFVNSAPGGCAPPFAPAAGTVCTPGSGTWASATATGLSVVGNATSSVTASANGSATACSVAGPGCSVSSGGVLIAQLVGNCCDCAITFEAEATVNVAASLTGSGGSTLAGSANANGSIVIVAPCDGITVNPGVARTTPQMNWPTATGGWSDGFTCTTNACAAAMTVRTFGALSTSASAIGAVLQSGTCTARATVDGSATVSATGAAAQCP